MTLCNITHDAFNQDGMAVSCAVNIMSQVFSLAHTTKNASLKHYVFDIELFSLLDKISRVSHQHVFVTRSITALLKQICLLNSVINTRLVHVLEKLINKHNHDDTCCNNLIHCLSSIVNCDMTHYSLFMTFICEMIQLKRFNNKPFVLNTIQLDTLATALHVIQVLIVNASTCKVDIVLGKDLLSHLCFVLKSTRSTSIWLSVCHVLTILSSVSCKYASQVANTPNLLDTLVRQVCDSKNKTLQRKVIDVIYSMMHFDTTRKDVLTRLVIITKNADDDEQLESMLRLTRVVCGKQDVILMRTLNELSGSRLKTKSCLLYNHESHCDDTLFPFEQ